MRRSPNALEKLLAAQRIHGFHYLALSLIALAKGDGPWTDAARRAALAEGRKFFAVAHQRNVPQLDAFFLPPLLEALGLNWSDRAAWNDSWLEDGPSSNGSEWDEAGASGATMPVAADPPQETLAADAPVQHLVRHHGASDYCDFHQCDRVVCLCWD